MRCPECQIEFTPDDTAVPCRCSGCDSLVVGPYRVVDWVGSSTLGDIYRATESGKNRPTIIIAVPKNNLDAEAARQQCATLATHTRQLVEEQFLQSMHRGEEMGRSYLVLEPTDTRPVDQLLARLESQLTKTDTQTTRIDVCCPHCETVYHLRSDTIGQSIACPNNLCGQTFTVPLPQPEPLDAQIVSDEPEPLDAQIAKAPASDPQPSEETPQETLENRSGMPRKVIAITIGLIVATSVMAWRYVDWKTVLGPDPDAHWANIMDRVEEKKWDRLARDLDRFDSLFPNSPRLERIPFYRDLARAGHNVYSPSGNASKGLSTLESVVQRHRDLPPDPGRSDQLFDALARLVSRLAKRASDANDPKLLDRARLAHQLADTLGAERRRVISPGNIPFITLPIDLAEATLHISQQEQEVNHRLEAAKRPDLSSDPDLLYAEIAEIRRQWLHVEQQLDAIDRRMKYAPAKSKAALNDIETYYHGTDFASRIDEARARINRIESEIDVGLREAYRIEAERVTFTPASANDPVVSDAPISRQGTMLSIVLGEKPGEVTVHNDTGALNRSTLNRDVLWALTRGVLHAFTPDGSLLWARRLGIDSHRLPIRIECPTVASPLALVVSTDDNALIALEEATGRLRWRYPVRQDIAAAPTIIRSKTSPWLGLLPTVDGDIHVVELSLGKQLGRYHSIYPLANVSGTYDPTSGIAFFAADARRLLAINPAAINDPMCQPCRGVMRTDHTSGSFRCSPFLIGRYLIVLDFTSLHSTRIRAFPIGMSSALDPSASPRAEAHINGWSCFDPLIASDRFTLITDCCELGIFGLNFDNPEEILYPIVPTWNTGLESPFRSLMIRADENSVWFLANRSLQKMSVNLLGQQFRSQLKREDPLTGVPIHRAQVDLSRERFFLSTTSAEGQVDDFSAFGMVDGNPIWRNQIGVNLLGDPLPWEDGALLIDRSGRSITLRPGRASRSLGHRLPKSADNRRLMRLGHSLDSLHLAVPLDGETRLAILRIDPDRKEAESPWFEIALPDRLYGRPCVQDDFVIVPCSDGQIYRLRFRGDGKNDRRQLSFATQSQEPVDLITLDKGAILMTENVQQFRRLNLRLDEKVARWEQVGGLFIPDVEHARLVDLPVRIADKIYVFDTVGTLYRIDASNPATHVAVWHVTTPVTRGPVLRGDRLLAVLEDRRLACFTPGRSSDVQGSSWISEPFGGRIRGIPQVAGDVILVADNSRRITAIGINDGQSRWQVRLRASAGPSASPVPCAKNKMLIPLSDGTLTVMTMPQPD